MKKIAIVTILDFNYGNRLQNFALQTILQQKGYYTETLTFEEKNRIDKIKSFCQAYTKNNRFGAFLRFNRKIKFSNFAINSNKPLPSYFQKVVVGSDQVWNIEFPFINEKYFLSFVPVEKRFSYAASFGVSDAEPYKGTVYQNLLQQMSSITVREHAGARIIEQLTGKKAEVVLDPVFLLSKDLWEKISQSSAFKPKGQYAFCYFLGNMTLQQQEKIEKIAREKHCEIVKLKPGMKSLNDDIGPAQFVDLIANSAVIFTDSYHAIVFSLIFGRNAYLFTRQDNQSSMSSRFETLFSLFHITLDDSGALKYNREKFDEILLQEQKRSVELLCKGVEE